MKPILLVLALALGLTAAVAVARAEEAPAPDPNAAVNEYHSPLRATWRDEVKRDPGLKADIEDALRLAVHTQESASFTRNNRHVVMAYIAIWVITAGFVLVTFLRQHKLKAEIAGLRADLARALDDGKAAKG